MGFDERERERESVWFVLPCIYVRERSLTLG